MCSSDGILQQGTLLKEKAILFFQLLKRELDVAEVAVAARNLVCVLGRLSLQANDPGFDTALAVNSVIHWGSRLEEALAGGTPLRGLSHEQGNKFAWNDILAGIADELCVNMLILKHCLPRLFRRIGFTGDEKDRRGRAIREMSEDLKNRITHLVLDEGISSDTEANTISPTELCLSRTVDSVELAAIARATESLEGMVDRWNLALSRQMQSNRTDASLPTPTTNRAWPKEPSEKAMRAFVAVTVAGAKQALVAKEFGVTQSTVSRWVEAGRRWTSAGNMLPDGLTAPARRPKTVPMDPRKLEQGPRRRGRA